MTTPLPPEGFRYRENLLSPEEEHELAQRIAELPLREFEFHGYLDKRRVIFSARTTTSPP